ncbi:MAG: hypothetical protein HOD97_04920 [Candidatus Marinimicrobia bacterium]|nr:hypothetical protein [Candidatus Neomarinimicrobiota bacterium]MBT3829359.1 hypothetical protein [Candidatus Neomarinimicrobiota bacterium]MBT3997642.1 hypothetical protein [Candidatus Neomarinimicrobiota bacterium]MBT4280940.1 hypothetical protein [Candidatus Neomarinimicrobiota bacterium]MBT4569776.1 hypothetical protein [Candidatus Neomarinimicrobiota bacterium]
MDDEIGSEEKPQDTFKFDYLKNMFNEDQELIDDDLVEVETGLNQDDLEEEWVESNPEIADTSDKVIIGPKRVIKPGLTHLKKRFNSNKKARHEDYLNHTMFKNIHDLKRAIIFKEILDKPRALRRAIR